MTTSSTLYCDECGAALTTQGTYCPVCHHRVGAPTAPIPRVPTPSLGVQPMIESVTVLHNSTVLNQRYIILEPVGEGGFGLVYKARDSHRRNRLVAVKQINLSSLSSKEMIEATDSYNRETSLLARLHHKHLPAMYDHFTDPGHWYVVMDFIDGVTLEEYLAKRRGKHLSLKEVQKVGLVLCEVLDYLHKQSPPIIFRDVKPTNIMRTKIGQYFLIDFGIARQYTVGKSRDTGPLGSPGFAPPEQYGRAQTDARSDIYSLGATLQTLLTGQDPLDLANNKRAQRRMNKAPERLKTLLSQMLQQDAERRPATILEVKYHLENCETDGLLMQGWRKVQAAGLWIFKSHFIIWMLTCLMGGAMIFGQSAQMLPYLILMLLLLIGISVLCITEELEMQLKPIGWTEVNSLLRAVFNKATFPCFALTFLSWLYYLDYQDMINLNWGALYSLFYLLVGVAVVGFCLFALVNMIRQLLRSYQYRHGKGSQYRQQTAPFQRQRR
jgi:Protein kinase domain